MEVGSKGDEVEDEDDEDDEEARRCDASLFRVKMEEVEFGDDEKEVEVEVEVDDDEVDDEV